MNTQDNRSDNQSGKAAEQETDQKRAQNPNPRANENIKNASIPTSTEKQSRDEITGTEITDGEDG